MPPQPDPGSEAPLRATAQLPQALVEPEDRQVRRDRRWLDLAGLLVVLAFVAAAFAADRGGMLMGLVERVEEIVLDRKFQLRGPIDPSPEVALVTIDQEAIERYGRFPFDRSVLADALLALGQLGARQVLVDLVFSESAGGMQDGALLQALEQTETSVQLGYFFYTGTSGVSATSSFRVQSFRDHAVPVPSRDPARDYPILRAHGVQPVVETLQGAADDVGYLNVRVDHGGIVRRAQLLMAFEDELYPSSEVVAAGVALLGSGGQGSAAYLDGGPYDPVLRLADRTVPLDPSGAALINYPGPEGTFPTVDLVTLLDGAPDPAERERLAGLLGGRTVLLGPSAVGIWDHRDTPFGAAVPAMEVHAAILDNLVEDRFLRRPGGLRVAEWLAMLALGLLLTVVISHGRTWIGALVGATLAIGVVMLDLAVLFPAGLWCKTLLALGELAVVFVVVSSLRLRLEVLRRRRERAARAEVMTLFGRYVAPEVVNRMLAEPDAIKLGGERRELSMLFSDIRGFTSVSEQLDPEELAGLLGEYLGAMTAAVREYHGMLDKFMGDGLMALFGVPFADPGHATSACQAALAKLRALDQLNQGLLATGAIEQPLQIGIGINSGTAAVGNMGSHERFEYTAIGDEVNLASRLEGLTKQYGVHCIVSRATRAAAGSRFQFRELDRVRVKGREAPVTIDELVGLAGGDPPAYIEAYEQALRHYRRQAWDEAERACHEVFEGRPLDPPTQVLLERIATLRADPPPEDWDGSFRAETK